MPSNYRSKLNVQQPYRLPTPSAEERVLSQCLVEKIGLEIDKKGGAITFEHYMNLVLYEPDLGYYRNCKNKFGHVEQGGDFITAPSISPLFARSLAQPILRTLKHLKQSGFEPKILEFGAGEGVLAAQLLPILSEELGEISYQILELSSILAGRQRLTLQKNAKEWYSQVSWLTELPQNFIGVMFGNEVLDAMPIRLFERSEHDPLWLELGVKIGELGTLTWCGLPNNRPPPYFSAVASALPTEVPYILEIHEQSQAFICSIADSLQRGVIILIDYGFTDAEYYIPERNQGTLMCHYRHIAHGDVFFYPGLQDITAHVNFSGLYASALDAGLDCIGYCNQARFLLNTGLLENLAMDHQQGSLNNHKLNQGVLTLISEAEMGELFKVIGFSKGVAGELQLEAFGVGNRMNRL